MASISIKEDLWGKLSDAERSQISAHLIKHKVMNPNDEITGNATAEGFFDDINPGKLVCQIACDAASAAALAALTLTGPAYAAAVAAIAVARDACRNGC